MYKKNILSRGHKQQCQFRIRLLLSEQYNNGNRIDIDCYICVLGFKESAEYVTGKISLNVLTPNQLNFKQFAVYKKKNWNISTNTRAKHFLFIKLQYNFQSKKNV